MIETERAWLAGLLEGEGSFFADTRWGCPIIAIQMTDRDVIEHAAALMETRVNSGSRPQRPHHKQAYTARLAARSALDLMRELAPLLGARRRETIEALLAEHADAYADRKCRCGTTFEPRRRNQIHCSLVCNRSAVHEGVKRRRRAGAVAA